MESTAMPILRRGPLIVKEGVGVLWLLSTRITDRRLPGPRGHGSKPARRRDGPGGKPSPEPGHQPCRHRRAYHV